MKHMAHIALFSATLLASAVPANAANVQGDICTPRSSGLESVSETVCTMTSSMHSYLNKLKSEIMPVAELRFSANALLGKPIYALDGGNQVGKVKDVLFDENGTPVTLVAASGGFYGIGTKYKAYPYDTVVSVSQHGEPVLQKLPAEILDAAQPFSYASADANDGMQVIPAGQFALSELMDAKATAQNGQTVGAVAGVVLQDGKAKEMLIEPLKSDARIKPVAHNFSEVALVREDDTVKVVLNANTTANLDEKFWN